VHRPSSLIAIVTLVSTAVLSAQSREIVGAVRDARTQRVIEGAVIASLGGALQSVRADSAGAFRLGGGTWRRVRVTRIGYAPTDASVPNSASTPWVITLVPIADALDAVTVRGVRGGETAPITRSARTRDALQSQYVGQEVGFVLARTQSVTVSSDAGSEQGYTYLRVRGLDQTRVNMTLDGVPLNEPEDQGVYFSNYPDVLNSVDRAELVRGVGTSTYGTAAIAGSLNLESQSPTTTPRGGALEVTRGSYRLVRYVAQLHSGLRTNGWGGSLRLSTQRTDGFRRGASNASTAGFASGGWFGSNQSVTGTAFAGRAANGMAYLAAPRESLLVNRRYNPLGDDESDQFAQQFGRLTHTVAFTPALTMATTLYHVRLQGDYDVRSGPDLLNFGLASAWTGVISTAHSVRGPLTVDLGLHANTYERAHRMGLRPSRAPLLYENTGRKREASAFGKASVTAGSLTWFGDLQVRRAQFAYQPDPASGIVAQAQTWTFINPHGGATWQRTPQLRLIASVGYTQREPSRSDMFAGFDNLDSTNAAFVGPFTRVRPEAVTDFEFGAIRDGAALTTRLTAFWMAFQNEIAPIGALSFIGLPLRKNVARSRRLGIEAELDVHALGPVSGTLSAALMQSRFAAYTDDATAVTYTGVAPLASPAVVLSHTGRVRLISAVALTLHGRYSSASLLTNSGDRRFQLPAAYLADAGIEVGGLWWDMTWSCVVFNVVDTPVQLGGYTDGVTTSYFPAAGRHVVVSARVPLR